MARLHRRYGKRRKRSSSSDAAPRHNPPLMSDLVEWVAPGFAGFAATRFLTRIATTQVEKLKPDYGKHAGALASAGSFLASWFLANKVGLLERYQMQLTVGSAIAAIQSLIQIYIPRLGWMVSDATPDLLIESSEKTSADDAATSHISQLDLKPTDEDPNEFVYNDMFDAGRYGTTGHHGHRHQQQGQQQATDDASADVAQDDMADLQIDDAIGQTQNLGVFTN